MGTNFYSCTEGDETERHIGKQSGGWPFTFNFDLFLVWEYTKDPRWAIVRPYIEWTHNGGPLRSSRDVPLTETDVWDALSTPGYEIIQDEYGREFSLTEFRDMVEYATPILQRSDTYFGLWIGRMYFSNRETFE